MTADEILEKIMKDGVVDKKEVDALERMVNSDWVVDRHEVELLFRVNKAIGDDDDKCSEWTRFFVATVTRLIVADMETPGTIDADEGDWIGEVFEAHTVGNDTEKQLIDDIQKTTTSVKGKIGELMKSFDS